MTIAEAVTKAVAGGYHVHGADGITTDFVGANSECSAWTRTDNASTFLVPVEETFLDPRFWQALGRTLGWKEACELYIACGQRHDECRHCHGAYWMYHWHCFIQALAEGNTPEVFFEQLTSHTSIGHR
jgi:hypothetical protein